MHFEKAGNIINCDCSDKIGLAEKILVLVSILKMFPNYRLNLVMNQKSNFCSRLILNMLSVETALRMVCVAKAVEFQELIRWIEVEWCEMTGRRPSRLQWSHRSGFILYTTGVTENHVN
jgi:hypothetical protein